MKRDVEQDGVVYTQCSAFLHQFPVSFCKVCNIRLLRAGTTQPLQKDR